MAIPENMRETHYECCGIWWRNGEKCQAVLCPVEKERQKIIEARAADEGGNADA